jgi:hypothetical protein
MPCSPSAIAWEASRLRPVLTGLVLLVWAGAARAQIGYAQPQSSPSDPQPARASAHATGQHPAGWLRLGASFGIFPYAGRLKYDLVYRGRSLDSYYQTTPPSPCVAVFADARLRRFMLLGLSLQVISRVGWTYVQPTVSANPRYGGTGHELDLLTRLGFLLPLTSRLHLLVVGAPGYSFVDVSGIDLGPYSHPSTMSGFVVQADSGLLYLFAQHGFAQASFRAQWGFPSNSVTSGTTGQAATAELRSRYFGPQMGVGYWF